jgi:hypothetical protein
MQPARGASNGQKAFDASATGASPRFPKTLGGKTPGGTSRLGDDHREQRIAYSKRWRAENRDHIKRKLRDRAQKESKPEAAE